MLAWDGPEKRKANRRSKSISVTTSSRVLAHWTKGLPFVRKSCPNDNRPGINLLELNSPSVPPRVVSAVLGRDEPVDVRRRLRDLGAFTEVKLHAPLLEMPGMLSRHPSSRTASRSSSSQECAPPNFGAVPQAGAAPGLCLFSLPQSAYRLDGAQVVSQPLPILIRI